jgi:hypothetical protein
VSAHTGLVADVVNGWSLNGLVSLQSGQPYNVIDFSGAVASVYNSTTVNISDPIIGFTPGLTTSQILLQGTTGINVQQPLFDGSKLFIPTVAPGTYGVPACATVSGAQVCDTYETSFSFAGRNTFRAPFQSRADVALSKTTRLSERMAMQLRFEVFNVFNHPDFDAPATSTSLYSVTHGTGASSNVIKAVTARAPTSSLGLIQGTLGGPRIMQISAHFRF